jgi:peptidyl-prolyl cis-trans isomerase SurA
MSLPIKLNLRFTIRQLNLFVAAAIFTAFTLGSAVSARAQAVDRVVGSVDGEPITTHDIKAFSTANGIALPPPDDPRYDTANKQVLKGLIEQKMLEQESKKYADKVEDSQIDAYIAQLEQQNHVTDQQFRDQLTQNGLTYDEFREHARADIERMAMLQDEVRSKITVSQAQVEAYFKDHQDEFEVTKETFDLAQILIAVPDHATPAQVAAAKAKAEDVRAQAAKGVDFGDLAREYSDDDSKSKGGELGEFSPGDIMPAIDDGIENLNAGQISPVIKTEYGFHIIKVEQHERPGTPTLTPEIEAKIRDKISTQESKAQFQGWVENDLVKEHHIEAFY